MDKIEVTFGGRAVYWIITPEHAAMLLQSLVQTLGPAKEN